MSVKIRLPRLDADCADRRLINVNKLSELALPLKTNDQKPFVELLAMRGYNLMQAIACVFCGEEGGLVVDYVGIAGTLQLAK